jgi:hypothetical protein
MALDARVVLATEEELEADPLRMRRSATGGTGAR